MKRFASVLGSAYVEREGAHRGSPRPPSKPRRVDTATVTEDNAVAAPSAPTMQDDDMSSSVEDLWRKGLELAKADPGAAMVALNDPGASNPDDSIATTACAIALLVRGYPVQEEACRLVSELVSRDPGSRACELACSMLGMLEDPAARRQVSEVLDPFFKESCDARSINNWASYFVLTEPKRARSIIEDAVSRGVDSNGSLGARLAKMEALDRNPLVLRKRQAFDGERGRGSG